MSLGIRLATHDHMIMTLINSLNCIIGMVGAALVRLKMRPCMTMICLLPMTLMKGERISLLP